MSAPVATAHVVVRAGASSHHVDARHDLNSDGNDTLHRVSRDELNKISEVFKHFQTGPNDPTMEAKNLSIAMKQLGLNPTEAEIQDTINAIEVDGTIDFSSFSQVVVRWLRDDDEENFRRELFRTFVGSKRSANSSTTKTNLRSRGLVSKEKLSLAQFKQVMLQLPEAVTEKQAEEIFTVADHDGNGIISYDEFRRMCVVQRLEILPSLPP